MYLRLVQRAIIIRAYIHKGFLCNTSYHGMLRLNLNNKQLSSDLSGFNRGHFNQYVKGVTYTKEREQSPNFPHVWKVCICSNFSLTAHNVTVLISAPFLKKSESGESNFRSKLCRSLADVGVVRQDCKHLRHSHFHNILHAPQGLLVQSFVKSPQNISTISLHLWNFYWKTIIKLSECWLLSTK